MSSYYVRYRNRVLGPFTAGELTAMAAAGKLTPLHMVSVDQNQWTPATEVKGLFRTEAEPRPAEERPKDPYEPEPTPLASPPVRPAPTPPASTPVAAPPPPSPEAAPGNRRNHNTGVLAAVTVLGVVALVVLGVVLGGWLLVRDGSDLAERDYSNVIGMVLEDWKTARISPVPGSYHESYRGRRVRAEIAVLESGKEQPLTYEFIGQPVQVNKGEYRYNVKCSFRNREKELVERVLIFSVRSVAGEREIEVVSDDLLR